MLKIKDSNNTHGDVYEFSMNEYRGKIRIMVKLNNGVNYFVASIMEQDNGQVAIHITGNCDPLPGGRLEVVNKD